MSIEAVGFKAYADAMRNFSRTEADLKQATSAGAGKKTMFASVLDQTLVRDSVDKGEGFGAHADAIKSMTKAGTPAMQPNSFSDTISQSVNRLNALQEEKAMAIDEFATGRSQNVHELMITLQKASLAMSLTSAVRGKVLEAYKELSRIQF